jgi:hypothetical protein
VRGDLTRPGRDTFGEMPLLPPIDACAADLTGPVRTVLDAPPEPGELRVQADGIPFVAHGAAQPRRIRTARSYSSA